MVFFMLDNDEYLKVPPWDCQWRETGLRRFYAAKDTVESAKGIAKTMLIDRLQSLIAVLITLIGVLLANSAPEPTDWMNETHRQSNNKSLNKNSQDWLDGEGTSLKEEVANHRWLSSDKSFEYLVSVGGEEECCPSQMEMIEPIGGSNPKGLYVELYSDGADRQRFYEVSCKEGVEGKPCLFMQTKLHKHSTCEQQYSYSYAIVREENARHHHHHFHGGGGHHLHHDAETQQQQQQQQYGDGSKQPFQSLFPNDRNVWKLDYIRVRSGCACKVQSPKNRQQKQRRRNGGGGGGGKRSRQQ